MPLLAAGHKRTGACPTFERPVLQRDGLLLRISLVGGALTPAQATVIAEVADQHGSGVIEATNRGNLQVRGVREHDAATATSRLRAHGLGDPGAALVTTSPFADAADRALRSQVLADLDELLSDGPPISPKFVVHVDDAAGTTASRRAEATLTRHDGGVRVRIDSLGEAVTDAVGAVALVRALATACRSVGDDARVADVVEASGLAWLHAVLPGDLATPAAPASTADVPRIGPGVAPDGTPVFLAAARFGRVGPAALHALAALGTEVRVTPWRSFVIADPHRHDHLEARLAAAGLLVDPADPAAGVVSCIGAAGCWQTEADTWAEAERITTARADLAGDAGIVHVSGCDKRCATRGPVAVTLLGRPDGSGFDEVVSA